MKLCATEFPDSVETMEQKEHYVESLAQEYSIEISVSEIQPDKAMYSMAKIILNRC